MKATVSVLALAVCLAACTTSSDVDEVATAADSGATADMSPGPVTAAAPTLEEARAFVARAEKELSEFIVISSKAQWVNATYITPSVFHADVHRRVAQAVRVAAGGPAELPTDTEVVV